MTARDVKAVQLLHEADGTRYRLLVVVDPEGGLIVTWPDARWAAWASEYEKGEVRSWVKGVGCSRVDLRNIVAILDQHVRGKL